MSEIELALAAEILPRTGILKLEMSSKSNANNYSPTHLWFSHFFLKTSELFKLRSQYKINWILQTQELQRGPIQSTAAKAAGLGLAQS